MSLSIAGRIMCNTPAIVALRRFYPCRIDRPSQLGYATYLARKLEELGREFEAAQPLERLWLFELLFEGERFCRECVVRLGRKRLVFELRVDGVEALGELGARLEAHRLHLLHRVVEVARDLGHVLDKLKLGRPANHREEHDRIVEPLGFKGNRLEERSEKVDELAPPDFVLKIQCNAQLQHVLPDDQQLVLLGFVDRVRELSCADDTSNEKNEKMKNRTEVWRCRSKSQYDEILGKSSSSISSFLVLW